jgi:hypothetical protein
MSEYQNQLALALSIYLRLYLLLGVIELTLRKVIPDTLSSGSRKVINLSWLEILKRDKFRAREIETLEIGNLGNLTERLSFGFWCRIFVPQNYGKIWLTGLYAAFPQLESDKSRQTYIQICNLFKRASRIRNRVAHFQMDRETSQKGDERVLIQLIQLMGASSFLIEAQRLIEGDTSGVIFIDIQNRGL